MGFCWACRGRGWFPDDEGEHPCRSCRGTGRDERPLYSVCAECGSTVRAGYGICAACGMLLRPDALEVAAFCPVCGGDRCSGAPWCHEGSQV